MLIIAAQWEKSAVFGRDFTFFSLFLQKLVVSEQW